MVAVLQVLGEFSDNYLFTQYSLLKPQNDAGLSPDISIYCKNSSHLNQTTCTLYKSVLQESAKIIRLKANIGLIFSFFTFLYGALSDTIGRKKMMQFYMFFTFTSMCLNTYFVQFEYDPIYLVYSSILYYIGGGVSVLFVIAFAHIVEVTPPVYRQIGICLMQMTIYISELLLIPYGFIIDIYWMEGLKYSQWFCVGILLIATILFTFTFPADNHIGTYHIIELVLLYMDCIYYVNRKEFKGNSSQNIFWDEVNLVYLSSVSLRYSSGSGFFCLLFVIWNIVHNIRLHSSSAIFNDQC